MQKFAGQVAALRVKLNIKVDHDAEDTTRQFYDDMDQDMGQQQGWYVCNQMQNLVACLARPLHWLATVTHVASKLGGVWQIARPGPAKEEGVWQNPRPSSASKPALRAYQPYNVKYVHYAGSCADRCSNQCTSQCVQSEGCGADCGGCAGQPCWTYEGPLCVLAGTNMPLKLGLELGTLVLGTSLVLPGAQWCHPPPYVRCAGGGSPLRAGAGQGGQCGMLCRARGGGAGAHG